MLALGACGDTPDEVGSFDASAVYDASAAAPDATAAPDAAVAAADAAPPVPVTFRLAYEPSGPGPAVDAIYVEIACTQTWVSVVDGDEIIRIDSDCGLCPCNGCDGCAVCDCAWLMEPIEAGTHRDYAWDGVTHPTMSQPGCGVCETTGTLAPGEYTARFCYWTDPDGAGERICADEPFTYPAFDAVVVHTVTSP